MILKRLRPPIELVIPLIKEELSAGKRVRLSVTGNSMYPLLRGNTDSVVLSKIDNINKFDVILYRRADGNYVLHRVIAKKDDTLTLAGDAKIKKEYPVYVSDCIGKMSASESRGKIHTTDETSYKLYCRLWLFVFPFRRVIIACFSKGRRLLSRIVTPSNG